MPTGIVSTLFGEILNFFCFLCLLEFFFVSEKVRELKKETRTTEDVVLPLLLETKRDDE